MTRDPSGSFLLDPRLAADTLVVGDLPLSRVLLMNDSRFPWLILVPRREGAREIVDLTAPERALLVEEVASTSAALRGETRAEKLNVGAIGNRVPQLHVHVVARFAADAAWPAPVWGFGTSLPYAAEAAARLVATVSTRLGLV